MLTVATGGAVDTSTPAAHVGGQGARMSAMSVRHRTASSPRVPPAQSLRLASVQVRQVHVSLLQPVDAQQSRQVAYQRLPVPLRRLPVRCQVLPFTQGPLSPHSVIQHLSRVFCVFLFYTSQLSYYCERGGVDLLGLKPDA